jgi:hypothetical protein
MPSIAYQEGIAQFYATKHLELFISKTRVALTLDVSVQPIDANKKRRLPAFRVGHAVRIKLSN